MAIFEFQLQIHSLVELRYIRVLRCLFSFIFSNRAIKNLKVIFLEKDHDLRYFFPLSFIINL